MNLILSCILLAVLALSACACGLATTRKLSQAEKQLAELEKSAESQKERYAKLQKDYDELQTQYEALRKSAAAREGSWKQAKETQDYQEARRMRAREEQITQRLITASRLKEWRFKWQLFKTAPAILEDYVSKGECLLWPALLEHDLRPDMDFAELKIVTAPVMYRMKEEGITMLGDVLLCDEDFLTIIVKGFGPATQRKLTEFLTANGLRQCRVDEKGDELL